MKSELQPWLAAGLLLLVVAQAGLLLTRRARLKRRLHLPILIVTGLLVVALAFTASPTAALILTPIMALWVGHRMWMVRFCEICGTTNKRGSLLDDTTYCHKCGSAL